MAEQYAGMLRKAVARVSGAEARGEVYVKARELLLEQLDATRAPRAEIAHQRVLLEEAIQEVEMAAVEATYKSIDRLSAKAPQHLLGPTLKGFGPKSPAGLATPVAISAAPISVPRR